MGRKAENEMRKAKSLSFLRRKPGKCQGGKRTSAGSGACVVYFGGNANNGANDGVGYANVNNGLTNSNANIGARLATQVLQRMEFVFPHRRYRWIEVAH